MPVRATNITPADAYRDIKRTTVALRRSAVQDRSRLAAGCNGDVLTAMPPTLGGYRSALLTLAATPGLLAYVKDQESDPNYDVVAEYSALLDLIVAAGAAVIGVVPKAGGFNVTHSYDNTGALVPREFDAATLAAAIPAYDALIAAIE